MIASIFPDLQADLVEGFFMGEPKPELKP